MRLTKFSYDHNLLYDQIVRLKSDLKKLKKRHGALAVKVLTLSRENEELKEKLKESLKKDA